MVSIDRAFRLALAAAGVALAIVSTAGTASAAAVLTHEYSLNGTFADSLSGPSMVGNGGSLGATGLTFGANQGPNLSSAIDSSTYSIELSVTLDSISGYRKIVDFKNRGSDTGFYNLNGTLAFYNVAFGGVVLTAGAAEHIVITRDDSTDLFSAYVNGLLALSFTDSGNLATFSATDNIVHFLRDDAVTGGEATSGFLDYVRIYDGVLTASEALSLSEGGSPPGGFVAVPEPAPIAILGLALIGLAVRRKST